ncbi:chromate transporter [Bradyrhizobium japonicum]|uniref:chromate transporter n=1 Tax=Bradyrhizobium japonicum TaxID=375 RepID=UPI003F49AC96
MPGPLFTFAAYLGTVVSPERHGLSGAALGLVGIFLPGILVLLGALPFWDSFRKRAGAQAMMRGVNAAVVGVLGAALYDPADRLARPSARRRLQRRRRNGRGANLNGGAGIHRHSAIP